MTKRKYAQCGGIHGDIFNVASATIHPVRRGLLSNEFALSIVYYKNVYKKEMRNVITKEGYLSAEEAEKDRSLFDLGFRIDKLASWQRIAERRENPPNIAFKGYQNQLLLLVLLPLLLPLLLLLFLLLLLLLLLLRLLLILLLQYATIPHLLPVYQHRLSEQCTNLNRSYAMSLHVCKVCIPAVLLRVNRSFFVCLTRKGVDMNDE